MEITPHFPRRLVQFEDRQYAHDALLVADDDDIISCLEDNGPSTIEEAMAIFDDQRGVSDETPSSAKRPLDRANEIVWTMAGVLVVLIGIVSLA